MFPFPGSSVGAHRLADWVEAELLLGAIDSPLSRAELRDELDEELDDTDVRRYDESDPDPELLGEHDVLADLRVESAEGISTADTLADATLEALGVRAAIVGKGYPFEVEETRVGVRGDRAAWPVYRFLLLLSLRYQVGLPGDFNRPARLFERLSAAAWAIYMQGRAEHFGWPRSGPPGQRSFSGAVVTVMQQAGERMTRTEEDIPARLRDMECDVIAWRRFAGDQRRGNDVLLAQCAIGAGWDTKHVSIERWQQLVTFAVSPSRGSSFPFVPRVLRAPDLTPNQEDFEDEDLGAAVGLWLDRLRIASLLGPAGGGRLDADTLNGIEAWTADLLGALSLGREGTGENPHEWADLDA